MTLSQFRQVAKGTAEVTSPGNACTTSIEVLHKFRARSVKSAQATVVRKLNAWFSAHSRAERTCCVPHEMEQRPGTPVNAFDAEDRGA